MKKRMKSFLEQVLSLSTGEIPLSVAQLGEMVSVKNIGYSRTGEKTFQKVLDAMLSGRAVKIEYHSPHTGKSTERDILPLHLLSYMGTWHIVAYCALRNGLRDFTLSRIAKIEPSRAVIDRPGDPGSLKEYIRRNFGILKSGEARDVCIRFTPEAAPWIEEQVWHPAQETWREGDGSLCLKFPVADFREVKREILWHGAQVEVLSPRELREEVLGEIEKMSRQYSR